MPEQILAASCDVQNTNARKRIPLAALQILCPLFAAGYLSQNENAVKALQQVAEVVYSENTILYED